MEKPNERIDEEPVSDIDFSSDTDSDDSCEYEFPFTSSDSEIDSDNEMSGNEPDLNGDIAGMKYSTFFSSLVILLKHCLICGVAATTRSIYTKGSALCVNLLCKDGHKSFWSSQPKVNGAYMGNILTVASIVFGGGTYAEFKSIANILKLQIMSSPTFYALQKKIVFPVINSVYRKYRDSLIDKCNERGAVEVSGDGRCDSPGYNAKYCTYSIIDQFT